MALDGVMAGGIGWRELSDGLRAFARSLREAEGEINGLNVYPVADHDTGTNLAETMTAVAEALDPAEDMASLVGSIARAALLSARGNSGLILAEYLRGFASELRGEDVADGIGLARALHAAASAARSSVARPVEGTILTVADAMAEAARGGDTASAAEVLRDADAAAAEALARSPLLLPEVASVGVDAGAKGLSLLPGSLLGVRRPAGSGSRRVNVSAHGPSGRRAELVVLLQATERDAELLRDRWAELGDSIVIGGDDGAYRCHLHTDRVSDALAIADALGRVTDVRVEPLPDGSPADIG